MNSIEWHDATKEIPSKQGDYLVTYQFGESGNKYIGVLTYLFVAPKPHFQHEGLSGMHVTHWANLPEFPED